MPNDFTAKKSDEYFIAIAHQGFGKLFHSFVILGVVVNGQPTLLTRVAKGTRPGDKTPLVPGRVVASDLRDEGIERPDHHKDEIHYSAYAITYDQTLNFLKFLDTVNIKQPSDRGKNDKGHCALLMSDIPDEDHLTKIPFGKFNKGYVRVKNKKTGIDKLYYVDKRSEFVRDIALTETQLTNYDSAISSKPSPITLTEDVLKTIIDLTQLIPSDDKSWYEKNTIFAYKPKEITPDGTVTFEYTNKPIVESSQPTEDELSLYNTTQEFTYGDTCRHTAVNLVKIATGNPKTPHNVSSQFLSKLPIKTTLVAGKLSEPFFILPPPPKTDHTQQNNFDLLRKDKILKKLYHRMEKLSTRKSSDALEKFNLIKSIYNQHAGENSASANDIIVSIKEWLKPEATHKPLYNLRETYFFDHFFKRKSTTEKMFYEIQEMEIKPSPQK